MPTLRQSKSGVMTINGRTITPDYGSMNLHGDPILKRWLDFYALIDQISYSLPTVIISPHCINDVRRYLTTWCVEYAYFKIKDVHQYLSKVKIKRSGYYPRTAPSTDKQGHALLFSGGKDSIIALEILRHQNPRQEITLVYVKRTDEDCTRVLDLAKELNAPIVTLDPMRLTVGKKRVIPDTFLMQATAYAASVFRYVSMGADSSCQDWHELGDFRVNHQLDKSLEVMLHLSRRLGAYYVLSTDRLSSTQIIQLLGRFKPSFLKNLVTCNYTEEGPRWCMDCEKCAFNGLLAFAHLKKNKAQAFTGMKTFNWTLYNTYLKAYEQGARKPLECIGTREEITEARKILGHGDKA